MFERLGGMAPAPPEGSQSPLLWGTEGHVRELLGDAAEFERHAVEFDEPSPKSYADFMLTSFPPLIAARPRSATNWCARRTVGQDVNEADDGTLRYRAEYLVSTDSGIQCSGHKLLSSLLGFVVIGTTPVRYPIELESTPLMFQQRVLPK